MAAALAACEASSCGCQSECATRRLSLVVLDAALGAVAAELVAVDLFCAIDCTLTALLQLIHSGIDA
jgi:hypothetical protein